MATNDFVAFGTGVGANVLTQANYLTSGYGTGFAAGSVASSAQVGKAIRQGTFVAAAIAQFVSDVLATNVLDDGNVAGFKTNFQAAILASIPASGVLSFNGRSGVVNLTGADVLTALGNTPVYTNTNAGGDLSGTFGALTIGAGKVTNAKLANMAALTVKANLTGAPGVPADWTIAQLALALGIGAQQVGANGYLTIGAIIIQWGFVSCGDDSLNTAIFPIAFPTSCDWLAGGVFKASVISGGNGGGFYGRIVDRTQAQVGQAFAGGTSGDGVFWLAIGH